MLVDCDILLVVSGCFLVFGLYHRCIDLFSEFGSLKDFLTLLVAAQLLLLSFKLLFGIFHDRDFLHEVLERLPREAGNQILKFDVRFLRRSLCVLRLFYLIFHLLLYQLVLRRGLGLKITPSTSDTAVDEAITLLDANVSEHFQPSEHFG